MNKFKAWDKKKNEWVNNVVLSPSGNPIIIRSSPEFNEAVNAFYEKHGEMLPGDYAEIDYTDFYGIENIVICFSTGLLDKNGNEIYEGDIVETRTGKIVIEFREGGFGWISKMDGELFIGFAGHNYFKKILKTLSRFEIIGNINQNPELLK